MRIAAANTVWMLGKLPDAAAYRRALRQPRAVQEAILARYLRKNAGTQFGRAHGFAQLTSAAAYRQRVSISRFEDYRPDVEKIAAGEQNVLTRDRVRHFALSSGSATAEKWIPYTGELIGEFGRAIGPWMVNLFGNYPVLRGGPAYWSITPVGGQRGGPSAVPVGFDEDSAYLGGWFKRVVDATLAVPGVLRHAADMDAFRYLTLLCLLRARELRLISVWHPSFLTLLLSAVEPLWDRLLEDIRTGQCRPPGVVPPVVLQAVCQGGIPNRQRAAELKAAGPQAYATFWPRLALVSCWSHAQAAMGAAQLSAMFPSTPIQGKGLLSTEGFVSIPLQHAGKTVHPLAIRSHFFEFLPDSGSPVLAHQVDAGAEYSVLLSTAGGLYRYDTGDRIRITGRLEQTPCVEFIGKADKVSDRCGEKLNSVFLGDVLAQLHGEFALLPRFSMVAPDGPGYTLFLEVPVEPACQLAARLDTLLKQNPHFAYCRALGQLAATRVFWIQAGGDQCYVEACRARGQRLGNIKPTPLHCDDGWARVFHGQYVLHYGAVSELRGE